MRIILNNCWRSLCTLYIVQSRDIYFLYQSITELAYLIEHRVYGDTVSGAMFPAVLALSLNGYISSTKVGERGMQWPLKHHSVSEPSS